MKVKEKTYLYTHTIDNIIFYVGVGCMSRAYNFSNRKDIWKKFADGREVEVKIIESFSSRWEALSHERVLIKAINPECNILSGHSKSITTPKHKAQSCISQKEIDMLYISAEL